jgi:enterochelin esterase-like enzyme
MRRLFGVGLGLAVACDAAAAPPVHATIRGGEITNVTVTSASHTLTLPWAALSRTKLDPGPVTVNATVPGDRAGVEIPTCGRRGAVTIDGTPYAPPPGPFVVRLAPRTTPHTIAMEITVSEYERRIACGDPIRAGALVDTRDGATTLDFASSEGARGGGHAVLYVPPGHDMTKPAALLVGVYPWNGDIWTYAAYAELLQGARANDVVLLMPSGLGNSLYTKVPEEEVMRAIDAAKSAVAVDARRVSIWGASMGGQGACTIGLHRPDRFAFITSYFGDARFDLASYVRAIIPTPEAAHRVNPIDVIDNARHVPIWLIHGDADRTSTVRESDDLDAALRQRSYSVRYDRVPGRGHEGLLVAEHIADVVARAAQAQIPVHPARVTFRSVRPEDDRAYGVRVVRSSAAQDAFVDLEQVAGRIVVHAATGVSAIVLEADALGAPHGAPVSWDGAQPPHVELRWE